MRFEHVKNLKAEEFRRLTGVKRETFQKMVEVIDSDSKSSLIVIETGESDLGFALVS